MITDSSRRWRKANSEKVRAHKKRHYAKYAERERARSRRWKLNNPEKRRQQKLRARGFTIELYEIRRLEQDGRCAICFQKKKLGMDHNHKTGKARGLLCNNCNAGLGMFSDSIVNLDSAKKYLCKFQTR